KRIELEQLKAAAEVTGQDVPPDTVTPVPAPPRKVHVIRPGDSPALISLLYGVPFSAIRAANPNANLNRLRPGDPIFLQAQAGAPFSGPGLIFSHQAKRTRPLSCWSPAVGSRTSA